MSRAARRNGNGRAILVGFDGTDEGRDALALGMALGEVLGADLIVGSVVEYKPEPQKTSAIDVFDRAVIEQRHQLERTAGEQLGGAEATFESILALSAAHGLEMTAAGVGADMIVVGSTHRGPLGRVAPGTMAERLLSGGPHPVGVAPRGYAGRQTRLRAIGAGYDGSAESHEAVRLAADLAIAYGGRLTLIRAIEPQVISAPVVPAPNPRLYDEPPEAVAARRERGEREIARALENAGPKADGSGAVEIGDAVEVLHAATVKLDLLILGSRAYGPLRRVLLGSISSKVIRGAECPMLVAPRGDREDEHHHRVHRTAQEAASSLIPLTGG